MNKLLKQSRNTTANADKPPQHTLHAGLVKHETKPDIVLGSCAPRSTDVLKTKEADLLKTQVTTSSALSFQIFVTASGRGVRPRATCSPPSLFPWRVVW